MSDFEPRDDPLDDELGAALRRRAGRVSPSNRTSTTAAHDAVVRRAGVIRRRRVAVGGGGAMAVLLLGGILLLPRGGDEQNPVVTGDVLPTFDEPSTTVATTAPTLEPIDDAAPVTIDLSIPPVTTDPTVSSAPTTSAPTASTAPSSIAVPTSVAGEPAATVSSPTSDTVASSSTTPTSSAPTTSHTATPAPFTNTYQSTGGSITVGWNGSALSLQAVSPASGFVPDVEDSSATRVRVRFEGPDDDSRIEVRVADGQILVDID